MALTKVINNLADLNQSGSTNALKGCAGTTAQQPASSSSIEYLIVAGGAGGGWSGGGGGAGGLLTDTTTVYHGIPTVLTIGEGGDGILTTVPTYLGNGNDSGFNGIRTIGGGTGGSHYPGTGWQDDGKDGGSGGGGASTGYVTTGGNGTTDQGMGGGIGFNTSAGWGGGGGGGAGTTVGAADGQGDNGTANPAGNGGSGRDMQSFISSTNANLSQIGDVSGSNVWFAGGGGGGIQDQSPVSVSAGTGGVGGGADGSNSDVKPTAAQSNTGGGGGGGGQQKTGGTWYEGDGGDGGSGVVVLKYDNTIVTGYTLNSEDTYTINWPADKYGVAYWPLNLDVKDVGGNYDGTATDITYTNGKFNQAASFNGSSSHIDVSSGLGTSGNRTRAVWIYINGLPASSSGDTIYYLGANGSNTYYESLLVREISGSYHIRWHDRYSTISNDDILDSITTVTTGVWYHVAIVRDGTTQKMYINGSLDNSRTNSYPIVDNTAYPLAIGQWNGSSACCYYEGLMEQLRFYTSALSDSDILDIYNNSKPGSLPPLKTSSDLTTAEMSFPSGATTTALWDFNGDLIADPTTYNGTDAGAGTIAFPDGKFGECAQFNGSNMLMSATHPTVSDFTLSAWVKTTASGAWNIAVAMGATATNVYGLSMWISGTSNSLYGQWGNGSSEDNWSTLPTTVINTGEWFHIAVTVNNIASPTVKGYINGILEGSGSSTGAAITFDPSLFTVGGRKDTLGALAYYWNGEIDQVRMYNSTLTDQNIYDLWQKENDIQTYFPDTPTSGTDTLVFKEGSGEITFKNDTPPGAEVGMLRYNSTLGQMEHFNSGGWKDFSTIAACTTDVCNFPVTGECLYQLEANGTDTCGNYNLTTPSNSPTYGIGKFGNCAVFNGTNQSFDQTNNWGDPTVFSLSFWINFDAVNVNQEIVGCYNWNGATSSGWKIRLLGASSGIEWQTYLSNTQGTATSSQTISASTWYHIAFTANQSTVNLYINGILDHSTSISGFNYHGGVAAEIGESGGYDYLGGKVDQFRLFTSILTSDEVLDLYNNEVQC